MNTTKIRVSGVYKVSYNDLTISNLITHRAFKVSKSIIDSVVYFKDKIFTISDFENYCISIDDASNVSIIVKKLLDNNILIEKDVDETLTVVPHPMPLVKTDKSINIDKVHESVAIIGLPYGKGNPVSTKMSEYPSQIRLHCKNISMESIIKMNMDSSQTQDLGIIDVGDLYIYDMELPNIVLSKIHHICKKIIKNKNRILSLGGDHSITLPIIKAHSEYYQNITIIQLDAHTDHYSSKLHELYQKKGYTYTHHGNFMTKIIDNKKINNVIRFGVRGDVNATVHSRKVDKVENFSCLEQLISKIKDISNLTPIYITVDIDFFDSHFAPATSTPEIFGFSYKTFQDIIGVLYGKHIIGADLVEINPSLDIGSRTMQLSTRIIAELLKILCYEK